MSCSPVLKWFIILALPLTLGSKLIVRPDRSAPNETDVQQKVAEFLVRQHFTVALSDQPGEGQANDSRGRRCVPHARCQL